MDESAEQRRPHTFCIVKTLFLNFQLSMESIIITQTNFAQVFGPLVSEVSVVCCLQCHCPALELVFPYQ